MMPTSRIIPHRTFKNFGHKRQPIPPVTLLWQGFLTFTFIGMGIEWKRLAKFFFDKDCEDMESPFDSGVKKRESDSSDIVS